MLQRDDPYFSFTKWLHDCLRKSGPDEEALSDFFSSNFCNFSEERGGKREWKKLLDDANGVLLFRLLVLFFIQPDQKFRLAKFRKKFASLASRLLHHMSKGSKTKLKTLEPVAESHE